MLTAERRGDWQGFVALAGLFAAIALPLADDDGARSYLLGEGMPGVVVALAVGAAVVVGLAARSAAGTSVVLLGAAIAAGKALAVLPLVASIAASPGSTSATLVPATAGFWGLVVAAWFLAWLAVRQLSDMRAPGKLGAMILRISIPLIFGAGIVFLWEVLVQALAIPFVIMPPPSAIWARLISSVPTLLADFRQTFLKAALAGYLIGCGSGFLVAILVDRWISSGAASCRWAISSPRFRSSVSPRSW